MQSKIHPEAEEHDQKGQGQCVVLTNGNHRQTVGPHATDSDQGHHPQGQNPGAHAQGDNQNQKHRGQGGRQLDPAQGVGYLLVGEHHIPGHGHRKLGERRGSGSHPCLQSGHNVRRGHLLAVVGFDVDQHQFVKQAIRARNCGGRVRQRGQLVEAGVLSLQKLHQHRGGAVREIRGKNPQGPRQCTHIVQGGTQGCQQFQGCNQVLEVLTAEVERDGFPGNRLPSGRGHLVRGNILWNCRQNPVRCPGDIFGRWPGDNHNSQIT